MARYRRFEGARSGTVASAPELADVRLRRAGLKTALSGLELALAAPGRTFEWSANVNEALQVLHEVWTRHIVETEAPGAFLDDLVEEAPRLYNQSLRLREEHGEILSILLEVDDRLQPDHGDPEWVERLRSVLTSLLVALARHRQRGADLVYEAYAVDIGGGF